MVPAANAWYLFKIQVEDTSSQTEVRARVWREGSSEPASWQASCSDTGTRRTSGTVGLWGVVSGKDSGTKHWDDLVVKSIGSPQSPTLTLTATPTTVDAGGSATLTWSSTHADSCLASGDWSGSKAASGNEIMGPLTGDTTYTLTCSGAGGSSNKTVAIAVGANNTPSIGGTPATSVDANTVYSFIANASDADGDILTFSITNKPNWASFNANTGALTGTPTVADSGTTMDIVISVSDGTDTASLAAFNITVSVAAIGNAALSWAPPSTNIDGTGLTDLAGYRIHYGTSIGTYPSTIDVNTPAITSFVVENLPAGNYFFVVTAYDTSGNESPFSNVASKNVSIP